MPWQRSIHHELQIHPRSGHETALGALIDDLVDGARHAPGCLECRLVIQGAERPWLLLSQWRNEEALMDYFASPSLHLLGEALFGHCRSLSGGILEDSHQATDKVA